MHSVILVGLPGSGKTTCGELLAAKLGWTFLDSDSLVIARTGLSVPEIFRLHGEQHFRNLESQALDDLKSGSGFGQQDLVLSTGGGLPIFNENMAKLLTLGSVVFLSARLEVLESRVDRGESRPLLAPKPGQGKAAASDKSATYERLAQLSAERAPVYERARYKIDTSDLSAAEVVNKIALLLGLTAKEQTAG